MTRTIYYNAKVITMEDHVPRADAVIVENGIIKKVLKDKEVEGIYIEGDEMIDLEGKALLPGFIDSYSNIVKTSKRFLKQDDEGEEKADINAKLDALKKAMDLYASYGITTAQAAKADREDNALLEEAAQQDKLIIDIIAYIDNSYENLIDRFSSPYTKYFNRYKKSGLQIELDGEIEKGKASLSIDYEDIESASNERKVLYTDNRLYEICYKCIENNWQLNAVCNGDDACEQFLECYSKALDENKGEYDLRPIMSHALMASEEQLDRMKRIGMIPSFFIEQLYNNGDLYFEKILGSPLSQNINPLKSALIRGINATMHQSAPKVEPNMIHSMHNAVNRKSKKGRVLGESEKISAGDAIRTVTINGAYQIFEEKVKGSIKAGKIADFVILDKSPFDLRKDDLENIKVLETIKDGVTIYKA